MPPFNVAGLGDLAGVLAEPTRCVRRRDVILTVRAPCAQHGYVVKLELVDTGLACSSACCSAVG
jgi:hypothetical protein